MKSNHKCPACGKILTPGNDYPWKPFCSERCKLIDLGSWLNGDMSIAGEDIYLEDFEQESTATTH